MIVISEKSLFYNMLYLKDKIIFSDYNDIVNKTIDIIQNYNSYYNTLFHDFDDFIVNHKKNIDAIYSQQILT